MPAYPDTPDGWTQISLKAEGEVIGRKAAFAFRPWCRKTAAPVYRRCETPRRYHGFLNLGEAERRRADIGLMGDNGHHLWPGEWRQSRPQRRDGCKPKPCRRFRVSSMNVSSRSTDKIIFPRRGSTACASLAAENRIRPVTKSTKVKKPSVANQGQQDLADGAHASFLFVQTPSTKAATISRSALGLMRRRWSASTIASMASATGTPRMPTHGSCRPFL